MKWMKSIDNKSVELFWGYLYPFCRLLISGPGLYDINDKNIFVNHFVNDFANDFVSNKINSSTKSKFKFLSRNTI